MTLFAFCPVNRDFFCGFSGESRIHRNPSRTGVSEAYRVKTGSFFPVTLGISVFFPVVHECGGSAINVLHELDNPPN